MTDREMIMKAMREEALARMRRLDIYKNAIRDFKKRDRVLNKSEGYGGLYWLDDREKAIVKRFEEKTGAMVYTCILTRCTFGNCLSLLYVSPDIDSWEMERAEIENFRPYVWVENMDCPDCSEMGTIEIRPQFGGLVRVA